MTLFYGECLQDPLQVPHRPRRSPRAVRHVIERLDRDVAGVAMTKQCLDERCEFLLTLPRTLAVAVVDLHMRDESLRQPALGELGKRFLFHEACRAAVEHAPE